VRKGGDRQKLHERIRVHSLAAAEQVKDHGRANDLLERIAGDEAFGLTRSEMEGLLDPALYTGRSAAQVEEFVAEKIAPIVQDVEGGEKVELKV
jgi:adenylosuccinate lyase